jgi:GTP cyclohydrolase IA
MDRKRAERAVEEFLRALGHDPSTDLELAETPRRVADAWADELLTGYAVDVPGLFAEASPAKGECRLVVLDDISVTTICPHHLLPAMGRARLAYRPGDRVFGLGTLARLVDAMSRRLVLQESIAERVVEALVKHGGARGAYCELTLRHGCLSARGGQEVDARVRTHAASGELALPAAAAEIALIFRQES